MPMGLEAPSVEQWYMVITFMVVTKSKALWHYAHPNGYRYRSRNIYFINNLDDSAYHKMHL